MRGIAWTILGMLVLAASAYGDKIPESDASKKIAAAPKQTMDNIVSDANQALKQGEERAGKADQER